MKKDTEIRKTFLAAGWTLRRSNGHMMWACPCGKHLLTSSHSISAPRAIKNTMARFRQLSRDCVNN